MAFPKSHDDCDPDCTTLYHTKTCVVAHPRMRDLPATREALSLAIKDRKGVLDALDDLVSYLSPADPDSGVAWYLLRSNLPESSYIRAYTVLREQGRRP